MIQREQTLNQREASLKNVEQNLNGKPANNWPRCRPFLYHNIPEEIPTPATQALLYRAYYGWYGMYFQSISQFRNSN